MYADAAFLQLSERIRPDFQATENARCQYKDLGIMSQDKFNISKLYTR